MAHTALEISDMISAHDVAARTRQQRIPKLPNRRAGSQDEYSLVDIDDDVAERYKVEEPREVAVLLCVRTALDPQQERNDSDLACANRLDQDDLADPAPLQRLLGLFGRQEFDVVAHSPHT